MSASHDTGETADFELNDKPQPNLGETQELASTRPADDPPKKSAPVKEAAGGAKATVLGDYRLVKKLGQGGMGVVFKAVHQSLDREVAVKVLSKELASQPSFVHRFLREAKVMAKLDHPHILRCHDAGTASGYHYLAIEFVEGGSVEALLKKHKKFSLGDSLRIILDCCAGLDHAHQQGMIHRDIKPDNILLTKTGVVKVADLGLAKGVDDDLSLTKTGTGAGTPIYMAPEQARDAKHVDHRADLYALGVMLYVFVTGEAPFKGTTLVDLISAKETGRFEPLRKFSDEVPPRLGLIVDKLLAKDPKLRYDSAATLYADLDGLGLANETLSFFAEAQAATRPTLGSAGRGAATGAKTVRPESATVKPTPAAAPAAEAPIDADTWYLQETKNGKPTVRRVTTPEVVLLVKTGRIDDTYQLAKSASGPFRSLGTFPKFAKHFKTKVAEASTGNTGQRFSEKMQAIERAERWWWLKKAMRRFFGKVTGIVSLILWLAILGAVGFGLYLAYVKYLA